MDFKVGDEVWWFQSRERTGYSSHTKLYPGTVQLVHDVITDIKGDSLICWHSTQKAEDIWGKTREEAWKRLKDEIEKWGAVE